MDLFHGIHVDLSMESMVDMPKFHMKSSGIHVELWWIPYGMDHSMTIPHGIHDVHGTMNWLWSQPTFIPWIPHGIADGFHMDQPRQGKDLKNPPNLQRKPSCGWLSHSPKCHGQSLFAGKPHHHQNDLYWPCHTSQQWITMEHWPTTRRSSYYIPWLSSPGKVLIESPCKTLSWAIFVQVSNLGNCVKSTINFLLPSQIPILDFLTSVFHNLNLEEGRAIHKNLLEPLAMVWYMWKSTDWV